MASRRRPPGPPPLEIRRFTPEQADRAIKLLETRMGEVKALDPKTIPYNDEKVRSAERKIRTSILEVFGEHSPEYRSHQVHEIRRGGNRIAIGWRGSQQAYEAEQQQAFLAGIPQTVTILESLIETVKERTDASRRMPEAWIVEMGTPISSDKVFIVHGRKEGPREAVARFVEKLGLHPVILHEQASEGRTIIEKIEHHSDVGYAVILLTADDRGGLGEDDSASYQPRARQNVVLELGYFLGKLGRRHVCVLHEPGVEIPSDYDGVVYVPLDSGGAWQLRLAKEMKATAFKDIDLNRAM